MRINNIFQSILFVSLMSCSAVVYAQNYKFDFGDGPVAAGYIGINSTTNYTDARGYGFDRGTVSSVIRSSGDALTRDYLTTSDELFFSVALPQGNYTVTVIFGDAESTSTTTIKAENRRLIFDRITTASGAIIRQSATLRRMETRSIDGTITMSIKDRELEYLTWDKVLTLRISGKHPAVAGIEITKNDRAITMFLCGNSTVVDQLTAPWSSWGQMIPNFFDSTVSFANYAESGLTAGGFLSMKRLSKLLTEAKPGDYVFVEFGHNDQKNTSDVSAYPSNLKKFSDQIKSKGAIPIFVIPTARQGDNDPRTSIGGLAQVMRETANTLGVTYIDLNQMVIDLNRALGADAKQLYMYTANDKTHFCEYGGYELARSMLKGLEEKIPALKSRFRSGYVKFNPSVPDPLNVLVSDLPPIVSGSSSSTQNQSSSSSLSAVAQCGGVPCDHILQGEDYCYADGGLETTNIGFVGAGYVNLNNAVNSKVTYMLVSNNAHPQTLYIRFSNGSLNPRNMQLNINSVLRGDLNFISTGSWTNWALTSIDVELPAGQSLLEFTSLSNDGGPNIDWIGWTGLQTMISESCQYQTVVSRKKNKINSFYGLFRGDHFIVENAPNHAYTLVIKNYLGSTIHTLYGEGEMRFSNINISHGVYIIELVDNNEVIKRFMSVKK